MALIKYEDYGNEVSDKAASCPNCGAPICDDKEESKAIIYGLSQMGILGDKLKIYVGGEYIGNVRKEQNLEIPIEKDCTITAKCGINPSKGKIDIKVRKTTKIRYKCNKLSGSFISCIVDNVTNTY